MARPIHLRRHIRTQQTDSEESNLDSVREAHFLDRTLRFSGPEMERAMRLYHHSGVLRRLLAEHAADRAAYARIAIAVSATGSQEGADAGPAAHVIVTREGFFVTCLAPGMSVRDTPVLPYAVLQPELDRAEAELALARIRRSQLGRLPMRALAEAILRGPGHLLRDMAEVVQVEPSTYLVPAAIAFESLIKRMSMIARTEHRILARRPLLQHPLWRQHRRLEGPFALCLLVLSRMEIPEITKHLALFARLSTPYVGRTAMALARHQEGGERLVEVAGDPDVPRHARDWALFSLTYHIAWHPENLGLVAACLDRTPPQHLEWLPSMFRQEGQGIVATVTQEQYEQSRAGQLRKWPVPRQGEDSTWMWEPNPLHVMALHRRPWVELFPPREISARVRVAWHHYVHQRPPEPEKKKGTPLVREGTRVGRNDPCPCHSGRKYKQCCLGRPAVPEEPAAPAEPQETPQTAAAETAAASAERTVTEEIVESGAEAEA